MAPTLIERAALYDLARFGRQFLHEHSVQDFHVVEHDDAVTFSLKAGAAGNTERCQTRYTVVSDGQSLRICVFEDHWTTGTAAADSKRLDDTLLPVESGRFTGLLSWLRLNIAGWLDAAGRC